MPGFERGSFVRVLLLLLLLLLAVILRFVVRVLGIGCCCCAGDGSDHHHARGAHTREDSEGKTTSHCLAVSPSGKRMNGFGEREACGGDWGISGGCRNSGFKSGVGRRRLRFEGRYNVWDYSGEERERESGGWVRERERRGVGRDVLFPARIVAQRERGGKRERESCWG